ncbi:hypothetical protein ACFW2X_14970 [Streptomyces antibioticus]|uniref:hypothetical protein n=1 Tax=Streptomyces antibioticus TaxID=1890 RepID=UPI00367D16C1
MTAIIRGHLNGGTVRICRGTTAQDSYMMLARNGDHFTVAYDPDVAPSMPPHVLTHVRLRVEGYTVTEIVLQDHGPHLTALYRVYSKLHLTLGMPRAAHLSVSPAGYPSSAVEAAGGRPAGRGLPSRCRPYEAGWLDCGAL